MLYAFDVFYAEFLVVFGEEEDYALLIYWLIDQVRYLASRTNYPQPLFPLFYRRSYACLQSFRAFIGYFIEPGFDFSGRVEAIYTPVEGEEVYEVIRKRLFDDLGEKAIHRKVADEYLELYRQLGEEVPPEYREEDYKRKMAKAYPFHPEVIDKLYERWSTFSTFQRTRGVLRFLAEVLGDLYKREHPAPLIQPAHINLANTSIRTELVKHIGNQFDGVIASDITGPNANAPRIDKEMGSEYSKFKVATNLATAVFFYSFSGAAERRGITVQRLRVAFLREGIPFPIVGDAIKRLDDELYFLHSDKSLYYFLSSPNPVSYTHLTLPTNREV